MGDRQPLVSAGIFTVVFGQIADLSTGDSAIPYFLFTLAGMLAWNLFNGSLGRASSSMVGNQSLVQKVFFPRLLVPVSSLASVVVDFLVALVLAVVLLFVYGVNPGWAVLLLPVWILLILMIGTGIGLAAAAYMVKYRDVQYVLPWTIQILLYASPVAYALSEVPDNLRWLFDINPVTWFLEGFRWSLLGTEAPVTWQVVALVVAAPLIFLGGTLVFQKNEREFADFI
ncbi:ABC transporter permease [Cellulosimicrobium sp. CUA-896]|uniref:ABC transporter permease n=1 Tax=Cellulosimicrobium sp. CUA-896 TaxID=1517881 RepID=UPI00210176BC|nr:ABC transporter permease [Cellulosimicrobium sp. CUA-896]